MSACANEKLYFEKIIMDKKNKRDLLQWIKVYKHVNQKWLKNICLTDSILHSIKSKDAKKIYNAKHKKVIIKSVMIVVIDDQMEYIYSQISENSYKKK